MSGQSRIRRFRTWVKVDGVYPGPVPCEGHRSKDRMILATGAVKRIDGSSVPAPTVSVEMIPVLRHSETSVTKATSATWPTPYLISAYSCRTDETSTRLPSFCTGSPLSLEESRRAKSSTPQGCTWCRHHQLITLERFWAERLAGDPGDAWVEELNYAPMPLGSDSSVPLWAAKGFLYVAAGAIRRSSNRPH